MTESGMKSMIQRKKTYRISTTVKKSMIQSNKVTIVITVSFNRDVIAKIFFLMSFIKMPGKKARNNGEMVPRLWGEFRNVTTNG